MSGAGSGKSGSANDSAQLPLVKVPPPRTFRVTVGWVKANGRGDFTRLAKSSLLVATDLRAACDLALQRQRNFICVSVEATWLPDAVVVPSKSAGGPLSNHAKDRP